MNGAEFALRIADPTLPVPARHWSKPPGPQDEVLSLLLADKRSSATKKAYAADLRDFFAGQPDPEEVRRFVALPPPEIALRLTAYKAGMMQRGLAEATVNRRLAAVRALLRFCFRLGWSATDGRSLVTDERVTPYRDTRGIDREGVLALFRTADTGDLPGMRDTALLRLLLENALRRAEVCALDVADFQPKERRLFVLGKGKGTQKEPETISARTVHDLQRYLAAAGHFRDRSAPLLRNLDRRGAQIDGRLTGDGIYHIVRTLGERAGLPHLTPHKLRHTAITLALDATNGNIRAVKDLSRHARLETLQRYDDNRQNFQGNVSDKLSDLFAEE